MSSEWLSQEMCALCDGCVVNAGLKGLNSSKAYYYSGTFHCSHSFISLYNYYFMEMIVTTKSCTHWCGRGMRAKGRYVHN